MANQAAVYSKVTAKSGALKIRATHNLVSPLSSISPQKLENNGASPAILNPCNSKLFSGKSLDAQQIIFLTNFVPLYRQVGNSQLYTHMM